MRTEIKILALLSDGRPYSTTTIKQSTSRRKDFDHKLGWLMLHEFVRWQRMDRGIRFMITELGREYLEKHANDSGKQS